MESFNIPMQPFFEWLLRTTIQASVLICMILLLQLILRGRLGPRWSHALWLVLLVRMALPWAPESRVSMFNMIPQSVPAGRAEYTQTEFVDESSGLAVTDAGTSDTLSVSTTEVPQETPKQPTETITTRKKVPSRLKPVFSEVAGILPMVWLAGALALAIYVCINNFTLLRIVRRERPLTDQKILDLLEDCKAEMGIRTILGVVPTDKVKSASLFGFVRPRLLLPKGMVETLNREELRYVFLHELGHLKRHDIYLGWLMSILQVLHWFNPFVWLAFYRMRADRELACDALVLAHAQSAESKDYGQTIVGLLERFSRSQRLPAMAGILETKTQLKRRITMIAKFKKTSYQWSPLAVILIIMLGCVSLVDAIGSKTSGISWPEPLPEPTLRQVRMESGGFMSISPDGKYLCDVDWDTGNLVVRELATGNVRPLTDKDSWEESLSYATISVISRDSKRVAFLWYNHEGQCFDLREIGLDGSGERVVRRLLEKGKVKEWFKPAAWSPDGKQILGLFSRKGERNQIVWVSTADGSVRTIKGLDEGWPEKLDVSPDGRYIAYDLSQEKETSRRDIFAFDIEENREVPLVQHPADDKFMGWTPDGKHIFFTSDRMRSWDGWILPVTHGEPSGLPELVKASIGDVLPIGFTQGGSFYYASGYGLHGVYTAALDLQTGKVLSSPKPVRHTGTEGLPDWSPDGKYLAYCTRPRGEKSQIIHIRSMETGQERQLDANLPHFRWLRWSPDCRSILVAGLEEERIRNVVYKVDVLNGERTVVLRTEAGMIPGAALSPDGKTLVYSHWDRAAGTAWFMVRDLETGLDKQLVRAVYGPHPYQQVWALSPDGEQLAFTLELPGAGTLNTISTTGGERKELLHIKEKVGAMAWTLDGQNVLFMQGQALWRIPAEGGEPRKLWIWEKRHLSFEGIRVHPDGRKLAFAVTEPRNEVWVMENFLPAAPVAKPAHQPNFRKIQIPTTPGNGVLSPDGKKLAFVSKSGIWVVPVHGKVSPDIAGEPVRLPGTEGAWHWGMSWSADGKWIAYNDLNNGEICVVPSSGGKVKRISIEVRSGTNVFDCRLGLSRDGRTVAYGSKVKDKMQIFTADVESGDFEQITEDGGKQPSFSPDGKKIAYVKPKPQKAEIPQSDIWVIPATGGEPVQVSNLPGRATGPVWSPDGKRIAFTRKTGGDDMSKEVCIVAVPESGKPEATPTQIELPLEAWRHLAGWTPDNEIGVLLSNPGHQAIYTVPTSGGNATQVTPEGYTFSPRWSPDGEKIYFRWNRGDIASVPSKGGETSTVPLDADSKIFVPLPGGGNAISPDGKKITFSGAKEVFEEEKRRYEVDIYTVPIEGGEPKKLTISPGQDRFPCWSPDGKSIAFIRYAPMSICIVPAEGGEVSQLTSKSDEVAWSTIAWSPDGKSIAYFSEDTIRVIPIQGGESSEVAKVEDVSAHSELAWSPDGTKLVYSSKGSIWVIASDGGQPEEIETGLDAEAGHVSWSPDGRKIAFTATRGGDAELWLMENFLPASK